MMLFRDRMRYIDFKINNPRCIHCYISERAYASVITEVMENGQNETGGVFLGYIINRAWYIVEAVDPGVCTVNQTSFFQWDVDYVNHQAKRLGQIYQRPLTILGFWHRHPGSMDYFSTQDETTIRGNLKELQAGLISMLVNIDPKLRMTFYHCYDKEIMPIGYDVGDKYFPTELLKYANVKELSRRYEVSGCNLEIHYEQVIDLEAIAARKCNQLERKDNSNRSSKERRNINQDEKSTKKRIEETELQRKEPSANTIIQRESIAKKNEGNVIPKYELMEEKIGEVEEKINEISSKLDLLIQIGQSKK